MFVSVPVDRPLPRVARGQRWACWGASGALLIWGLLDPRFRDAEGLRATALCLPLAMSAALLVLGRAAATTWRVSAAWFALALVGQAAALQFIDAGTAMRYQHYQLPPRWTEGVHPAALACLLAQTGLVAWGHRRHGPAMLAWVSQTFRRWQLVGLAAVFFLTSATVSEEIRRYPVELVIATLVQLVCLANVVLIAWALPTVSVAWLKRAVDRVLGQPGSGDGSPPRLDRFAWLAAAWVVLVSATLCVFSYQRFPHITDEVVYLEHARFIAQGALTLEAPPLSEPFDIYLMQFKGDRWYPAPPPGWPLALAAGVVVGAPWLVNPVLGGLCILLAYLLLQELYDRRTSRLAVLLLALSPWNLFMSMNFMTHELTLACTLLGAVGVAQARRGGLGIIGWAGLAGAGIGMVALIRPLDGAVSAGLIGLWALGIGGRRLPLTGIAAFGVGALIVGAAVLPYNAALTGHATEYPIMAYDDERFGHNANAYGFGPDRGMGWAIDPFPGHGPIDATINANLNTFQINIELFGWGTGSLLLVALIVLCGRLRRGDYLMLAVCAAVFWAYFFYYFSGGPDFGARYWFLMIIPGVALASRSIGWLETHLATTATPQASGRVMAAIVALCAMSLVNYLPWRGIDKYFHYLNMRPDVGQLADQHHFGRSLVLVRGDSHPDYAAAFTFNPLEMRGDVPIYAWDRSPELRARTIAAFADRPVWLVDGPSLTHAGFRVTGGPLSPAEALAYSRAP